MELNKETIHITDNVFIMMRADIDKSIQYLLDNMISKGSYNGKISLNISVGLIPEYIVNGDQSDGNLKPDWYIIRGLNMRSKQKCSLKRKKKA